MKQSHFTLYPKSRENTLESRTGLEDSFLSSTCGLSSFEDSARKIEELKLLYEQTIHQEKQLLAKNNELNKKLEGKKDQLNKMIDKFFRPQNIHQPRASQIKQCLNRRNKPGSILNLSKSGSILKNQQNTSNQLNIDKVKIAELKLDLNQNQSKADQQESNPSLNSFVYIESPNKIDKRNFMSNSNRISEGLKEKNRIQSKRHQYNKSSFQKISVHNLWESVDKQYQPNMKNMKSFLSPRHRLYRNQNNFNGQITKKIIG